MAGNSSSAGRRDAGLAGWLLALIFACLAAGIVAAGCFYYRNYARSYRAEVERQLSAIADLKADELVQWRKERLADGAVFFRNASFSGFVRHFLENPEDAQAQQQIQAWVEKYRTASQYDHVRLLDAQGVTRLSVPAGLPAVSSLVAKNVSEALRSGQVTFQDFYRSDNDPKVHLGILVPILDESDASRPLGVLILRIDPQAYLYPFIQRWPTASLTAETLLVRRDGNDALYLNDLRHQSIAALALRFPLTHTDVPAVRVALGQTGFMQGLDYRGVPVLASAQAVPDSPWFLIAKMDTAEVYAPLRERLWQMVVLIGALLFGAGAGIALLWRQQSARFYRAKYETVAAMARLAAIVESSDDAIIGKGLDGIITSWNAGAERLFGYTAAEMIGQPVAGIIPPDLQPWEAETLKRLQRGERVKHYEAVRIAKDGRAVDVSLTISPIRDAAGTIIGAAKIVRDITERKQAEQTLRDSEERFRATFEQAAVGIAQVGLDGRWLRVNQRLCEIVGYERAELLQCTFQDVTHPEDLNTDLAFVQQVLAGEIQNYSMVKRYLRKDRSLVWVNLTVGLVRTEAGAPKYFVSVVEDITERKRAEEALRESERRFRSLAVATSQIIWSTDAQGQVCGPMPSFQAYTGQSDEEIRGSGWAATLHPDDVGRTIKVWQEAVAAKTGYLTEYRLRRRDGVYRHFTARGAPVMTDDGRILEWIGTCSDITERKQAEEALQELQAFYHSLVDQLPAGVFRKDSAGRYVFVSPWFCRLKGMKKEDFLNKTPPEVAAKPDATEQATKYATEGMDQHALIMQTGNPVELVEEYTDAAGRTQFVHAIKSPVINSEGKVIGTQGLLFDITERKRAEEALRESESRFRQLAESLPQLVWTCQPDGPCDYLNRQWVEFTGVPEARQHGFGWLEQLHPDDRAPTVAAWEAAVASGSDFRVEFRIRRHDGEYRWFDTQAVRLRDAAGHTVKWFGANTDMTERKQAEAKIQQLNANLEQRVRERTAELEAANRELEAFSYSVSHDLRAPLRAIDGFSRILLEDYAARLDDDGKDSLARVRAASQRMGDLIDDLLKLAHAARAEMRRATVDLTALVGELAAELERAEPARRVRWVIAANLAATGDPPLLRVALGNLLNNAWKFTGPQKNACIEFGITRVEGGPAFFVRDNGVGFDMTYAGKLFAPFQRLHAAAAFPGTGIGLATVQRIIHRHGGRVWAEGEVNHGATFHFTLPETTQPP